MPPGEDPELPEGGEWGLFVARAVMDVRRDLGDGAADRVAASLMAQKAEAVEIDRRHLATTQHLLEQALEELEEARRSRSEMRAELVELETALDAGRAALDAEVARSEDQRAAMQAELDSQAAAAHERLAAEWEELREHEAEVTTQRAELRRLENVIGERLAEAESRLIEADNVKAAAAADRREAQRLVDEANKNWQTAQALAEGYDGVMAAADYAAKVEETVIELRESAQIGEARRALDARDLELREWEAELVRRTQELDLRDDARRRDPSHEVPRGDRGPRARSAWGRGRRD